MEKWAVGMGLGLGSVFQKADEEGNDEWGAWVLRDRDQL